MTEMMEEPRGQLRYRAAQQIGVSFPDRTIELIVMPYEREAVVKHQGRPVTEIVSRGAFDGIERRSNRVRVNRDHDVTRTVGRAVAFHPSREEGLVAELRIAQTPLGDETLQLADEEILDASAGFLPMPGGERWENRSRVRLTKLWLAHIAMTPDPAYESARVLAVRRADEPADPAPEATPNLDRLRLEQLKDEYAAIDARYQIVHPGG
jgi:HK97 family phage prohead protease